MNGSISSTSESTASNRKNIFKPSVKTVIKAFEVSLSDSTTVDILSNKTDLDVTSTSSKPRPFKSKTPDKQIFNVTLSESVTDSDVDKTALQSKPIFKKPNNHEKFVFNVSYNETNSSAVDRSINESDSTTVPERAYPFRKRKGTPDSTSFKRKNVSFSDQMSLNGQNEANESSVTLQDDSSASTRTNPFTRFSKHADKENFELKENGNVSDKSLSRLNLDDTEAALVNKSNPFKRKTVNKSINESRHLKVAYAEEEHEDELMESETEVLKAAERSTENIKNNSHVSSVVNKTANSDLYLDQSSFNDDNLNNWMSDHSDNEIPPPDLAPMTGNISISKERPQEEKTAPTQDQNTSLSWEEKFEKIVSDFEKQVQEPQPNEQIKKPAIEKPIPKPVTLKPKTNSYKPPKLLKPATFASKRLYQYIFKKLRPKYGIDTIVEAEQLVVSICDTVKIVCRRKGYQKGLINNLKKEMAKAGLIETTVDFYEFVINFLPYDFRVKVVPSVQPVTNTVFPPKDTTNPFDKIL